MRSGFAAEHGVTTSVPMTRRTFCVLLALLLCVVSLCVLPSALHGRPLETHEAFVAQTSREMIAGGEWIVPRFNGELRLKKPPLMYWLVIGVAEVTGAKDVPEWAARLPSVFATLVMVTCCVLIGARVFDRGTGLLAGAIAGVSGIVLQYGDNARPEMLYAACCAIGCLGFVSAARVVGVGGWAWSLVGWIGVALALLAKGPQLPLLLMIGQGGYVLWSQGLKEWLRVFRPVMGVVAVCAVALPWVLLVMQREPTALAVWKHELFGLRFGGDDAAVQAGGGLVGWIKEVGKLPYLLYCMSTLLPWGAAVPLAFFVVWEKGRKDLKQARDVFFAFAVALVGLSLASHSRDYYLLPAVPLLAVLLARGVIEVLAKAERSERWNRTASGAMEFAALLGLALAITAAVRGGFNTMNAAMLMGGLVVGVLAVLGVLMQVGRGAHTTRLALAFVLWATAFCVASTDAAHWRERHVALRELGREAREAAAGLGAAKGAEPLPVVAMGVDPNDLVYEVRRPVRMLKDDASAADLQEIAGNGACVIVATPRALEGLRAQGVAVGSVGGIRRIEKDFAATVVVVVPGR